MFDFNIKMNLVYRDEPHLIEQLQHSNETAFDYRYDLYGQQLFQCGCNRLRSEEIAQDMVQGWLISHGANIMQTDRPKDLLNYLKSRKLHP